jgi:DNA-binding beta-propeller fold protein YncE
LVFPLSGTGDIAPLRSGPTFIYGQHVSGSAIANELLVTVFSPSEVRGYLDTATGVSTPLRSLTSGVSGPKGIATTTTEIFVANTGGTTAITTGDSVVVFAYDAKTGDAPLRTIVGGTTGFHDPMGIAVSTTAKEIFVANNQAHTISVFDIAATGDATPKRTIKGAATGLSFPSSLTLAP